ncbi:MAG: hypothetical protein AAF992_06745 [Bacteroidota bacterium]
MRILTNFIALGLLLAIICPTAMAQTNLQQYTPSVLLRKGQWEFKHFTNVYTQTKAFDDQLQKDDQRIDGRQTFATAINQFMYGINPKYSVGFDVWVKYVNINDSQGQRNRIGLTGVGPKIKVAPFKNLSRLSFQSTFLIPISGDTESREVGATYPGLFLEFDRFLWINEAFYDIPLSSSMQLFVRGAWWTSFPRDSFRNQPFFETPITVFFNYFPNSRLTLYTSLEAWIKHVEDFQDADGMNANRVKLFSSFFSQAGLGMKYQLIPGLLEGELLYTNFWLGSPGEGAGQTFNFGLRVIH